MINFSIMNMVNNMKKNILVFGDSIVYGVGDNEQGGWVNRLRIKLEENQVQNEFNVFNLGISGQITAEIKSRFDFECNSRFDENAKTILVFSMGVNDTQVIKGKDRIDLNEFEENITNIINNAKKYTNFILFLGLTRVDESRIVPFPWNKDKSCFNDKISIFDKKLETICLNANVDYLNIENILSIEELADGLHPNKIGHEKICNIVSEKIKKYFD